MQSPNRAYVPELDQLRGIAALLVFFYHSVHTGLGYAGAQGWPKGNIITSILYDAHSGVALFMVLSGFVLARGALGPAVDYAQFLRNRALRIFPLMLFVLVFAVYGNTDVTLSAVVAPFLLLSNTTPRLFNDATHLSGTVWTIAVEFQFYLIAPFVFRFVAQRGIRYLLGAMLLAWIAKYVVLAAHQGQSMELYQISHYTIVGRLNQFLTGVGLAYLWPEIEPRLRARPHLRRAILTLSIVALAVVSFVVNRRGGDRAWQSWMIFYPEIEAAIFVSLIASFVVMRPFGKTQLSALAVKAGVISYSVYILHWPLEQLFWRTLSTYGLVPSGAGLAAIFPICASLLLPMVLAVAWLSYTIIERPFLEMRKRYVTTPSVREAAA